jgi:hypothetical protein
MTTGWTIDDGQAVFRHGEHRLAFEIARPQLGLTYSRQAVSYAPMLSIHLPGELESESESESESVADCYARRDDLVVTYHQGKLRTVQPQIRIGVLEAASDFVVQLIISMQTDLLESEPGTRVVSAFEGGELLMRCADAWRSTAEPGDSHTNAFLHRPADLRSADSDCSFFQLLHSSDLSSSVQGHSPLRAEFQLLSESLEKGVIRRARIMAGWISSKGDLETADRYSRQLAEASPPLAT